mgnify:CR=1 FL=1
MQKLAACLPAIFIGYFLSAQPSNASFLHYTTDEGLSSDNITSMDKDRLGFLWISTGDGLNRFDGRSFKIFRHDPQNKNSIPGDFIMGVTLAPDGWLWIATTEGLCKLDPVRFDIQQIPLPENGDTLKNDVVTKVAFDANGMAWTTSEHGIYQINPATGKPVFFLKTEKPLLGWNGITVDKHNRLWMTNGVAYRFDPATQHLKLFTGADPGDSFVEKAVLSLVQDASGQFWAGTWYNGIWKYAAASDEFVRFPGAPPVATVLLPDGPEPGGAFFWLAGGKSGLGVYYPGTGKFIEFHSDQQDPFTHNNSAAKVFFKDPLNGDVWIGTETGLEHYAPATIRFGRAIFPPEKNVGHAGRVSSVVQDQTDPGGQRYFIAVWGRGVFTWNKATGTFAPMTPASSGAAGLNNFQLLQDSRGTLWGCLKGGVGRYHLQTGNCRVYDTFFQHPERNNLIWCGLEDRRGNLWFGSNREGLFRYNRQADRVEPVFYKKALAEHYRPFGRYARTAVAGLSYRGSPLF